MSRYFCHNNTTFATYEQARAAARQAVADTGVNQEVQVYQDDQLWKTYVFKGSATRQTTASAPPDSSLVERITNLEAALADALSRLSALESKPRRRTKSQAA